MTGTQASVLLFEQGILAGCALLTLFGTLRAAWKVKNTAMQVKDVAEEAVSRL
jgi:hypothetical protein